MVKFRVLNTVRQAYCRQVKSSVSGREWEQSDGVRVLVDAHRGPPKCRYQALRDEADTTG